MDSDSGIPYHEKYYSNAVFEEDVGEHDSAMQGEEVANEPDLMARGGKAETPARCALIWLWLAGISFKLIAHARRHK